MPVPFGPAGSSDVIALLEADIPLSSPPTDAEKELVYANGDELTAALQMAGKNNGTVVLPAGSFAVSNRPVGSVIRPLLALDEYAAGITIQGQGSGKTVLFDPVSSVQPIALFSTRVSFVQTSVFNPFYLILVVPDFDQYEVGHVIYFWDHDDGRLTRSERSRRTVAVKTPPNLIQLNQVAVAPFTNYKHVKGYAVSGALAAGKATLTLEDPTYLAKFAPGQDLLIGDGPGINEFYGEWVRVTLSPKTDR